MCIRTPFWLWVIAVGSICAAPWFSSTHVNAQEPPPESSEARSLFNGTDLQNWDGDPRLWSVRDGVIHGETTPELSAKGNTFLIWQGGEVRNFILRFRFRCNAENNSGVQYRSKHYQESDAANAWVVRGYQHEIRNESQLPNVTGFIYDEGGKRQRLCLVGEKARWTAEGKEVIDSLLDAEAFRKLFRVDDWNDCVIVAQENHLQHFLNGKLTLDFQDEHPDLARLSGIFALQLHAGKPMWAEFKDLRLETLP